MRKLLLIIVGVLVLTIGARTSVEAQSATATLSGTVVDEQGAVVPSANITVVDAAKSVERTGVTDSEGSFTVTQLSPSTYTVNVERAGFATTRLPNVVLNVNDQSVLKIQLKVAQVGGTVTVSDSTSLVGESPAVSTVVDRQFVENQPSDASRTRARRRHPPVRTENSI